MNSSFYDENFELVSIEIATKDDFKYIDLRKDKSAMDNEFDKYTIEKEIKKNVVIYKRIGYGNGIFMSYKFEKSADNWCLVSILDEST